MTKIIVGSARSDERGKISGGKAGDQTGRELSTQNYYKHSKGWNVYRPKEDTVANKMCQAMKDACASAHIGYDQTQRDTLIEELKKNGKSIKGLKKNVETDCSALIRACAYVAGIELPDFNTASLKNVLLKSGHFTDVTKKVNLTTGSGLLDGDILCTKTKGHTVMVTSGGSRKFVATAPIVKPPKPKAAAVSKTTTSKPAKAKTTVAVKYSKTVEEYQIAYNKDLGKTKGNLKVDGIKGANTKDSFINAKLTIETRKSKPHLTKFVQKKVGFKGKDVDGDYFKNSVAKVKEFQKKHGIVPVTGNCSKKTYNKIVK